MASPEKAGRQASPTARVMDSRSVKTMETGGLGGFDADKEIMGRKQHSVTGTADHLVGLIAHIASIQDRDGAVAVLASVRRLHPWLRHIFVDSCYAGDKLRHAPLPFWALDGAGYKTVRRSPGLQSHPTTLGCRANVCLPWKMPQARQRLPNKPAEFDGMDPCRPYPAPNTHSGKTMKLRRPF